MKEYKYKINGNVYKVAIGDIEDNIAHVEVNGTPYKVEMEKAPKVAVKPVARPVATSAPAAPATPVVKPVAASTGKSGVKSPLPGVILDIKVNVGDTVKVHVQIKEGDKSRIQIFEGTVIAKKHGGINETFTVRRVAHGCGIERVFPLHAPAVDKVEVVRHGKVRRAKLYYLRDRVGKAAKVKEQIR